MDSAKSPSSSIRLLRLEVEETPPAPKLKSNFLLKLTQLTETLELVAKEAQDSRTIVLAGPRESLQNPKGAVKTNSTRSGTNDTRKDNLNKPDIRPSHLILVP
jgi:hypothetical protein